VSLELWQSGSAGRATDAPEELRMHRKRHRSTGRGTDAPEEVQMHQKRYRYTGIRSLYTIILAFIYTAALPAVERQA
jgi:hypothetical protein